MIQQALMLLADQEEQMFPFFFFTFGVPILLLLAGWLLSMMFWKKLVSEMVEEVGEDRDKRTAFLERRIFSVLASIAFPAIGGVAAMFFYMFFALVPLLEWSGVN